MAIVQCLSCSGKSIEDDDVAILHCPYCGSGIIKVIEHDE